MAVFCVPDTTCAHCGEEIEEDGLMVSKFQVMKADGSCHNYCRKCFPRVYSGVGVPGGWKWHFGSITSIGPDGSIEHHTRE